MHNHFWDIEARREEVLARDSAERAGAGGVAPFVSGFVQTVGESPRIVNNFIATYADGRVGVFSGAGARASGGLA